MLRFLTLSAPINHSGDSDNASGGEIRASDKNEGTALFHLCDVVARANFLSVTSWALQRAERCAA
jgi:hypothetical protein